MVRRIIRADMESYVQAVLTAGLPPMRYTDYLTFMINTPQHAPSRVVNNNIHYLVACVCFVRCQAAFLFMFSLGPCAWRSAGRGRGQIARCWHVPGVGTMLTVHILALYLRRLRFASRVHGSKSHRVLTATSSMSPPLPPM